MQPVGRATLGDQLRRHAGAIPDTEAVVSYDETGQRRSLTYSQLHSRANRIANALSAAGVRRGDRIAVMAANSADWVTIWYGALRLGAPLTGINPNLTVDDIAYQLSHAEPAAIFTGADLSDKAQAAIGRAVTYANRAEWSPAARVAVNPPPGPRHGATETQLPQSWVRLEDFSSGAPDSDPDGPVDEHDIAMIVYTSGTEARPKGVMIPHRNYLCATVPGWASEIGIRRGDRWLFVMPFFTMAGIGSMTNLTQIGATLVIPTAIDPRQAIALIKAESINTMAQTPTFFLSMARQETFHESQLTHLRRCITYGGLVPNSMLEAWSAVKPDLEWGTYWSQSELSQVGTCGWFKTIDDVPDRDPAWVGRAMPQLELRVVDPEGNDAEVGEVICRSPAVMAGYFADPDRTDDALGSGWLHTGDVMRIDAYGNLFFVDRLKDVIKTGGMNVSSVEVERVMATHPAVERVAVVGLSDPYWSEAVTAFVVLKPGAGCTANELVEHCRRTLAPFKVPKAVHFVDALPTDSQGKVLKRVLRSGPSQ
jgi:acyl-CoA synthetase (AMP-forming)/AMP-acid ligase II